MACLETSFIIDLLQGKEIVKALKEEIDRTETRLTIAAPSVMELWTGALISGQSEKEKSKIIELLQSLEILNLDEKSAKEAAEIEAELIQKGLTIETEDIMIAAIARINNEKLITGDAHYARIVNLRILKY